MLNSHLSPQTTYVMHLSQFTEKQCHRLDILILDTFLPLLLIDRSIPQTLVHGPLQFGGVKVVKQFSLSQDQWGFHYFIQSLRQDKTTAKAIHTVLNALQLVSGFTNHAFESPDIPITYLPPGWLPHIRDRLRVLGGSIQIEDASKPHLQQLDDNSIMEVVAANMILTPNGKLLANECRMWLEVITISNIADIDGQSIQIWQLRGFWRATTTPDLIWPQLPTPSKRHWSAFRQCL